MSGVSDFPRLTRMMNLRQWLAGAVGIAASFSWVEAEPAVWRSGPDQVALLELYTSEGCSSCPPAERWLSGLTNSPALWREIVPIEFHVDYWDNLGWPDRFASSEHTQRQQTYAELWKRPTIYTPGFVVNGSEWRWRLSLGGFPKGDRQRVGVLEVTAASTNRLQIHYSTDAANHRSGPLEVTAAWLGSDVVSDVRKGENAGSQLRHPFVALRSVTAPLELQNGNASGELVLPRLLRQAAPRLGVAVWVSRVGSPVPEQATGGWWTP